MLVAIENSRVSGHVIPIRVCMYNLVQAGDLLRYGRRRAEVVPPGAGRCPELHFYNDPTVPLHRLDSGLCRNDGAIAP